MRSLCVFRDEFQGKYIKATIVGYGSIGKRHQSVLQDMGLDVSVVSQSAEKAPYIYRSLSENLAATKPDYVVICNETSKHFPTLQELVSLGYTGKVLVEKPLFEKPHTLNHRFSSLHVGYNLRFHPVLQKLAAELKNKTVLSSQIYVGQHLSQWRRSSDFRDSYSAKKELGGGVLRDLSHELDYAVWLFGKVQRVHAIGGKQSDLEIESDDQWGILCSTDRAKLVTIQVNYLDHIVKREMIVNTSEKTYHVNLIEGTLNINGEIQRFEIPRDSMYRDMHRSVIDGKNLACSYEEGLLINELIERIEKSA